MSVPIDFSWKIDCEGTRRTDAAHAARIAAARDRIAAEVTQAPPAAEEKPMFLRIGWRLRLEEWFRPSSTKTRAYEVYLKAQAIPDKPDQPVEERIEPASLPGAGLEKLKEQDDEQEEEPLSASLVDETDLNMTRGDNDDHICALPPMPDRQRQAPVVSSEDSHTPVYQQSDGEPFLEDLWDDVLDAADAPGNRCSIRSPLPPEWRAADFSTLMSSNPVTQQEASKSTEYLPLPSAVFGPGPRYLPALSPSRSVPNFAVTSSRPGAARVDADDGKDGAQATPASGRWFRSVQRI
jgi:hypothetical protein